MCLAIPVQVTKLLPPHNVQVRVGESKTITEVSTLLLSDTIEVGDYLILHAGFALRKLDTVEAEESLKLFREIAEQSGMLANF